MTNVSLRQTIARKGLRMWQIADELGMTDTSFSRKLRYELSQEEKEKILAAIERLVKERDSE